MTKYLTDDEVIANTWFLTNYGVMTVITLSFATFELACNQKLYDEIRTVIITNDDDNDDRQLDVDRLQNLPLLEAVVCETLRLYSPTIMEGRIAKKKMTIHLGGALTGVTLRAEETIEFGVYPMHISAEYYPNPEQFKFDCFLLEIRNQLTPYAFLPFGLGPRHLY
ncbi:probable cytochrome P450 6t1 [Oppia nitens]|uniref:probable cytochrome P450 6t1 n=1 Tax=Oppia nitens TaxID=1686743 RepID=UPI0023DA7D37|nr:probable cytochrome P450 6t1 [Oppia nitens]